MLTRLYIEALLADEELADLVWEAWNIGIITDDLAEIDVHDTVASCLS